MTPAFLALRSQEATFPFLYFIVTAIVSHFAHEKPKVEPAPVASGPGDIPHRNPVQIQEWGWHQKWYFHSWPAWLSG